MNKIIANIALGFAGLFPSSTQPRERNRVPFIMDEETGVITLQPAGGPDDPSFISTDPKTRISTLNIVDPNTDKVIERRLYQRFVPPTRN